MRIISLLPSATEIICLLDLQDDLVGTTHECDYPVGLDYLPVVTHSSIDKNATSRAIDAQVHSALQHSNALYSLDAQLIATLHPDLLVTQSLCNVCAVDHSAVIQLAATLCPTPTIINLEPLCLNDMYATVQHVGETCGCATLATQKITQMRQRVDEISVLASTRVQHSGRLRVVFLEWLDPLFGSGHWIPEIIALAGGFDCLGETGQPAKRVSWSDVVATDPDILVVSCCGFDIGQTQADLTSLMGLPGWRDLSCVQSECTYVVDGNAYFSRPSPRLIDSLEVMFNMLSDIPDQRYQRFGSNHG
ncbi:MAG: hypothetical protein CBC79_03125 [Gammaproteobacteria bacterium TMED119]|nr:MAG: hypothetical protein CBC79_03125 [Gammaproteobacteria bacterium TMED119]RCL47245.1 MAG: cobalamin-binding protein [Candidatus Thioglobus sp.]|tara:strand:- start:1643 stop:2557 length:915 start_codon:yes stop_codon:yes gene_type:complete